MAKSALLTLAMAKRLGRRTVGLISRPCNQQSWG
jgi:hypothetical protein